MLVSFQLVTSFQLRWIYIFFFYPSITQKIQRTLSGESGKDSSSDFPILAGSYLILKNPALEFVKYVCKVGIKRDFILRNLFFVFMPRCIVLRVISGIDLFKQAWVSAIFFWKMVDISGWKSSPRANTGVAVVREVIQQILRKTRELRNLQHLLLKISAEIQEARCKQLTKLTHRKILH